MTLLHVTIKGGKGSGNFGHSGRPGMVGGSGGGVAPGNAMDAGLLADMFNAGLVKESQFSGISWETASYDQRGKVKDLIAMNLEYRGIEYEDANAMMKSWAASSNDNDMRSLAMQKDAAAEFGIPMSEYTQGRIDNVLINESMSNSPPGTNLSFIPLMEPEDQRTALRAMYNETQQALADAGYKPNDTIALYRGMVIDNDSLTAEQKRGMTSYWTEVPISGNPLESWSIDSGVAEQFADVGEAGSGFTGIVFEMDVPVKNIVSTARTGLGCLTEGEVVTMGSIPGMARIENTFEISPEDEFDEFYTEGEWG